MGLQSGLGLGQSATAVQHERSYGTPVDTVAQMRALGPADRPDNQWRALNDQDAFYEFEPASLDADDGDDTLKPDDLAGGDPGRWKKRTGGGMAPVASVFGRTGVVVAVAGDYDASEVTNDSGVVGAFASDALDTLDSGKINRAGDQELTGDWDTGANDILTQAIQGRSGATLSLNRGNGGTWASIPNAGVIAIGLDTRINSAVPLYFGTTNESRIQWDTFQTNPHLMLGVDSVTNVFVLTDQDRIGTLDLGINVQANPTFYFHDGSLTTTKRGFIRHNGTDFEVQTQAGSLLLKDAAGTAAITIANAGALTLAPTGDVVLDPVTNVVSLGGLTNTITLASGTVALKEVFTRIIQPDSGIALAINDHAGTLVLRIGTGSVRAEDDIQFQHGSGGEFVWEYETVNQTNNTLLLGTQGAEGNTVVLTDKLRLTLDHVVGTPTTPTFRYHDGSVTAGNYGSITHDGTNLAIVVNAGSLEVTGDIIPEANGTRSIGISTAAYGTGWFRNLRPDSGQQLKIRTNGGLEAINVLTGSVGINMTGADLDLVVQGDNDTVLLTTDAGLDRAGVGVALAAHTAKFHVNQNAVAGAIPVLALEQLDIDDSFINFIGTSAADSTRSISSSVAEAAAKVGAVLCEINGVAGWLRLYASAV